MATERPSKSPGRDEGPIQMLAISQKSSAEKTRLSMWEEYGVVVTIIIVMVVAGGGG